MVLPPLFIFELLGDLNLQGKIFFVVVVLFIAFEVFRIRKVGARIGGLMATFLFYGMIALVLAGLGVGAGWFDPNLGKIGADLGRLWDALLGVGANVVEWITSRIGG